MNAPEQFKPVPINPFGGRYLISNTGKVYSRVTNQFLKPIKKGDYLAVRLYSGGIHSKSNRATIQIHRLVAIAFIHNPYNKPFINHIDFNTTNNHSSNLEWCTAKENIHHSINADRFHRCKGSEHYLSKISEKDVVGIRKDHQNGTSIHQLSREYQMDRKSIRNIITRRSWKHVK